MGFYACKWLKFGLEPACQNDWLGKDNFCDSPFPCDAKLNVGVEIEMGNCYMSELDGVKYLNYKAQKVKGGD